MNYKLLQSFKRANIIDIRKNIRNGADIHFNNDLILHNLSIHNNVKMLKLLFSIDSNFKDYSINTAIEISIHYNCTKNIMYLLPKCENLHFDDDHILELSIANGNFDTFKYILEHTDVVKITDVMIYNIINNNDVNMLKCLIKQCHCNLKPNYLYLSIMYKNYDIAICLIENDLKINDVIFNSNQEIKRYDEFVIYSRRIKLKQII